MAMVKKRQGVGSGMPNQLSLFDTVISTYYDHIVKPRQINIVNYNVSNQLRNLLSEGLKRCELSRWEVAARMSELMETEVTKTQLDSWTAESKEYHRFPAEYLPAFCRATGFVEPLRIMAELVGCYLLESTEALMADLGRINQVKRNLNLREKEIRQYLKTVGEPTCQ
jgi:hypothetical protein